MNFFWNLFLFFSSLQAYEPFYFFFKRIQVNIGVSQKPTKATGRRLPIIKGLFIIIKDPKIINHDKRPTPPRRGKTGVLTPHNLFIKKSPKHIFWYQSWNVYYRPRSLGDKQIKSSLQEREGISSRRLQGLERWVARPPPAPLEIIGQS